MWCDLTKTMSIVYEDYAHAFSCVEEYRKSTRMGRCREELDKRGDEWRCGMPRPLVITPSFAKHSSS